MALRESDIEIWALGGGYLALFDRLEDDPDEDCEHVYPDEEALIEGLRRRLAQLRDHAPRTSGFRK